MQICVVLVFTIVMAAFSPFHAALNFELCFETQCQRHRQWSRHSLEDKQFAIVPDYFAIIHLVRMIQLLVKYSSKWPQGTPLILPRFSVVCLHCRQNRNVVTNVITEHRGSQICIFTQLETETILLHALHVRLSFLYSSRSSSFPRREITCFAVVWRK